MTQSYPTVQAQSRQQLGKSPSRRLRALEDKIPAVVYGGEQPPQAVTLAHNQIMHCLEEEDFYSCVLSLDIEGKSETVILKAMQRHPFKKQVMHIDFQRVDDSTIITKAIPIRLLNAEKAKGTKLGGKLVRSQTMVSIRCAATQLPTSIALDVAELALGQTLYLTDLPLPEGVTLAKNASGNAARSPVVMMQASRKGGTATAEAS